MADEITLQDAVNVINEAGGKAFASTSEFDDAVQGHDLYKAATTAAEKVEEAANKARTAAYGKASDILVNTLGLDKEEILDHNNIGEDGSPKRLSFHKLIELGKSKIAQNGNKANEVEFQALQTKYEELEGKAKTYEEKLTVFQQEKRDQRIKSLLNEALSGKALAIPQGADEKMVKVYNQQFHRDVLEGVELTTNESGQEFLKTKDGKVYSDPVDKLKELVNSSGYKFQEKKGNGNSLPNFVTLGGGEIPIEKRKEARNKYVTEQGITNDLEYWKVSKVKFGIEIPEPVLRIFPELKQ